MSVEVATFTLPGPLVGVGVDVVENGRVSERVAARIFTDDERPRFDLRREIPFCAREAVLKAVGGPGVLGAPLSDMPIAWVGARLRFVPGPKYRAIMASRGVLDVRLTLHAVLDDHTVVSALALGDGPPARVRLAWALHPVEGATDEGLTALERERAGGRPPSLATRQAARRAGRLLLGETPFDVAGGRDEPPFVVSSATAFVALAHEATWAVALVGHVPQPAR